MVIKKAKLIATHYYISVTIISKPDNNNLVTGRDRDTVSFLLVWTHFVHTAYIDQFVYCKDDQKWGESSLNWVLEHCSTSSIELNCQPWVFPSHWVHIHLLKDINWLLLWSPLRQASIFCAPTHHVMVTHCKGDQWLLSQTFPEANGVSLTLLVASTMSFLPQWPWLLTLKVNHHCVLEERE